MRNHLLLLLAALVALAAPAAGRADGWSLTLGAWGGVSRYDVLGLRHGVGTVGTTEGRDLLHGDFDTMGAAAVLRLGWLDLGFLYEGTLVDGGAESEVVTPVVGLAWNASGRIRIDVLGELGGHKINKIGAGNPLATETRTVWLPYVGLRPSVSLRFALGPAHLVLSATPFARWDLVQKDVTVPLAGGAESFYEAGGSTFGLVGGLGIEI